jgi:hypothetical protein
MANTTVIVRDGTDDPISFELLLNSSFVSLVGVTYVEIRIKGKDDAIVSHKTNDASPLLAIEDAANGRVKFSRVAATFVSTNSPYKAVFYVSSALGIISAYPENYEVIVNARKF